MTSLGQQNSYGRVVAAIVLIGVGFGAAALAGLPQRATQMITAASEAPPANESHPAQVSPPSWMMLPFVVLLAAIALMPLMPFTSHWWESNLHKLSVAGGLSLLTLAYYLIFHQHEVRSTGPSSGRLRPR